MTSRPATRSLAERLSEAEATIAALLSDQIDAVVDARTQTPLLLSKAQDALRESEERYRRIVETSNEGIWTVDRAGTITFVNARLAGMLGHSVEELIGVPFLRFHPAETGDAATARMVRSKEGLSGEDEVSLQRADGTLLWVLLKHSPIRDTAGAVVGTLAMMTDRTHARAAEEALRQSDAQYRQIVEATSDGVIRIDRAGRIVFVNRRFAEMLGHQPQALIGASVYDFMSPAEKEAAKQQSKLGLQSINTTFLHKDGSDIPVNIAASRFVDDEGRHTGNLGVVRDVTEQRRLTSQLMVSDRMASVGTLAAGVAHEINNPLAAVIGNLDCVSDSVRRFLKRESPSPGDRSPRNDAWLLQEIQEPLDDAREGAERVRFIVRDLKIFSRSPSEDPCGPIDVKSVMESSLRMAWNEIRHRARLVKHYEEGAVVAGSEARLGQVFLNLLVNAAQSMHEGAAEKNEIRVTTRVEGDRVLIDVSDTGPGIAPETVGRVFDAFFTTKAAGVGTGLGLAICQRIVTDMGGALTVESEVGRGTTFRVALRLASTQTLPPPATAEIAPSIGRRGRILVVDDEAMVARSVQRTLAAHEVRVSGDAKTALALVAGGERFDLILCDLMMPEMTGMDLHRELRSIAPGQADRMIFLTGGAFTVNAQRFLSESPKEFIEKPFAPANLRAIVQRHLR